MNISKTLKLEKLENIENFFKIYIVLLFFLASYAGRGQKEQCKIQVKQERDLNDFLKWKSTEMCKILLFNTMNLIKYTVRI